MAWFRRGKKGIKAAVDKKDMPQGVWLKCRECTEILYRPELEKSHWVCQKCGYHFRISSRQYFQLLFDEGSFVEEDAGLRPSDPLHFRDSKKYKDRIVAAQTKTGLDDAIVSGRATVDGIPVSIAALDFSFMGGSMGSVVGERIARAAQRAIDARRGLITLSASGGARMQEGILSLMQMAKTSAMLAKLAEERLPHISILTDPTTGGVTASFASLGDVILAEPKALVGFAGPRVIRETINQELPEGFQRSEFLEAHGFVDRVVHRRDLNRTLATVLAFFGDAPMPTGRLRRRQDDH
ncbi:MAG: acetyl-coenzyme A carboxylase carboxyl transferase subunit beta [Gemmatimonadota bacterium]|nr:MAG: acetyl-coenzyme A carboxylase carboxyl transferase subunit beta [Gemmatimonadota bacterium]